MIQFFYQEGSLGKGTAIKGKSDIDLVLVLNEVTDAADLREKIGRKKKEILELLTGSTQTRFKIVPDSVSETRFSVKFSVAGLEDNTDVDLLPTFPFQGTAFLCDFTTKMHGWY